MITKVLAGNVLTGCRQTLGLPGSQEGSIDDVLLAALLRRSAGIHCPCSRATLRGSLLESLQHLSPAETSLSDRIDEIIEGLIVGGDLLELNDVAIDDPNVKGTWVFAAPPSFVVRPSGGVFLLGIVRDQDVFLPRSLASRVKYEGLTRIITSKPDEELATGLLEQGLQQLSEDSWLKSPKAKRPEDMLRRFKYQLSAQPPSGAVADLQILDPTQPVNFYRGRWTTTQNQTGTFVARRPQEFGAPIWCFAELEEGSVVRLLDLPPKRTRWRGCDIAWHLQMAIDHCRHTPQIYRRLNDGDGVRLDFFSPLPEWSQRRLMIIGRPLPRERSLISYRIPSTEVEREEQFLQEQLWLSLTRDSD